MWLKENILRHTCIFCYLLSKFEMQPGIHKSDLEFLLLMESCCTTVMDYHVKSLKFSLRIFQILANIL